MIFLIFLGADLMNSALALTQVPAQLADVVKGLGLSPVMVVVAIMLFYVVLGAVMDELSMILLTIPIFFPMIMGLDFGMPKESVAIWFGIMVLMTVGFGLLAPPVGLNVYVVNGMAKDVPIAESYRGVMPFLVSDTIRTSRPGALPADLALAGEVRRLEPCASARQVDASDPRRSVRPRWHPGRHRRRDRARARAHVRLRSACPPCRRRTSAS